MARVRKTTSPTSKSGPVVTAVDVGSAGDPASQSTSTSLTRLPTVGVQRAISIAIVLHFFAISLSYLSTGGSSSIQRRALGWLQPYLQAFHFAADEVTLAVATSADTERTHVLETFDQLPTSGDGVWEDLAGKGIAGGDRQRRWQRWLAGVAYLGENQQGAMAAWLMEPMLETFSAAQQVRVVRQPDLMTNVVQDNAPPPYRAAILRGESSLRLVQVPEPRLVSPPVKSSEQP